MLRIMWCSVQTELIDDIGTMSRTCGLILYTVAEGIPIKVQVVSLYCEELSSHLIPGHTHWPIISICQATVPTGNRNQDAISRP